MSNTCERLFCIDKWYIDIYVFEIIYLPLTTQLHYKLLKMELLFIPYNAYKFPLACGYSLSTLLNKEICDV